MQNSDNTGSSPLDQSIQEHFYNPSPSLNQNMFPSYSSVEDRSTLHGPAAMPKDLDFDRGDLSGALPQDGLMALQKSHQLLLQFSREQHLANFILKGGCNRVPLIAEGFRPPQIKNKEEILSTQPSDMKLPQCLTIPQLAQQSTRALKQIKDRVICTSTCQSSTGDLKGGSHPSESQKCHLLQEMPPVYMLGQDQLSSTLLDGDLKPQSSHSNQRGSHEQNECDKVFSIQQREMDSGRSFKQISHGAPMGNQQLTETAFGPYQISPFQLENSVVQGQPQDVFQSILSHHNSLLLNQQKNEKLDDIDMQVVRQFKFQSLNNHLSSQTGLGSQEKDLEGVYIEGDPEQETQKGSQKIQHGGPLKKGISKKHEKPQNLGRTKAPKSKLKNDQNCKQKTQLQKDKRALSKKTSSNDQLSGAEQQTRAPMSSQSEKAITQSLYEEEKQLVYENGDQQEEMDCNDTSTFSDFEDEDFKPKHSCMDEGLEASNNENSKDLNVKQENQLSLKGAQRPQRKASRMVNYDQNLGSQQFSFSENSFTYSLVPCHNYKSLSAQPFLVYVSLEVQVTLNVHAHLSKNEVIGFLGGFCFDCKKTGQKYLLIHSAYPCNSIVANHKARQKNCEMCPESAAHARQQIQNKGQQIVGWYHSHPFFKVEPSNIDIRNHAVYQQNFDIEQMPFLALIIGPYTVKNKYESLIKIFHLKNNLPYNLGYKQVPSNKLRKDILHEMKELFKKYSSNPDSINLQDKWSTQHTREQKLMRCLGIIMAKNSKLQATFSLHQEILDNLTPADISLYFQRERGAKKDILGDQTNTSGDQLVPSCKEDGPAESMLSKSTCDDSNKVSYFSIESKERIERFISKVKKSIAKHLYKKSLEDPSFQQTSPPLNAQLASFDQTTYLLQD